MNRKSTSQTPEPVLQLQRQLEDFRSRLPGRVKLPELLWQTAVELARQYGIYPVAHPLRRDYVGWKKRLGDASSPHHHKATPPAFIEGMAAQPAAPEACVMELASPRGAKMRIHWRTSTPDWTELLHAWRETEK